MANIALDDVLQVSFKAKLFDQRILTVLHYFVFSTSGSEEIITACGRFASYFANNANEPLASYLAAACSELQFEEVRVQRVSPTREPYAATPIPDVGTNPGAAFNANTAASILKRTAHTGRWAQGRMQMAGGPVGELASGEWSAPYRANELSNLAQALLASATINAPLQVIKPCLYNPGRPAPHYSELLTTVVEREQRTMHRRTLRLGE